MYCSCSSGVCSTSSSVRKVRCSWPGTQMPGCADISDVDARAAGTCWAAAAAACRLANSNSLARALCAASACWVAIACSTANACHAMNPISAAGLQCGAGSPPSATGPCCAVAVAAVGESIGYVPGGTDRRTLADP